MKRFLCVLAVCLAVVAVSTAADDVIIELNGIQFKIVEAKKDDKIDKDKIIGLWEANKELAPGLPAGRWQFDKDGTVELCTKALGGLQFGKNVDALFVVAEGEYKIEGNKLTVIMINKPQGNKEITYKTTITKLTDKEFQTKDEKGKVITFKDFTFKRQEKEP